MHRFLLDTAIHRTASPPVAHGTMERFKSSVRTRHLPPLLLHASLESSTLVRTVPTLSTHRSLCSLLSQHLPYPLHTASSLLPPAWLAALSSLHDVLHHAPRTLTQAYQDHLEAISAVSDADHFAAPAALVLAAWVAEADPLASLTAGAQAAKSIPPAGSAAALARDVDLQGDDPTATTNSDHTDPFAAPVVLLVRRQASRQDAAALPAALSAASSVYGHANVLLLTLDADEASDESPASVAAAIRARVDDSLSLFLESLTARAERVRKATRSSFRSWFGGSTLSSATTTPPLPSITDSSRMNPLPNRGNTEPGSVRRLSIGAGGVSTPQFAGSSLEALSRRVADLCMLSGRYATAAEWYRLLAADCRSLVGAAKVHEAAALEGFALATAMVDGSKQAVGTALEKCVKVYCEAGRRELAVRAVLRAVAFCNEAGFPDSAAGVIIRALEVIAPPKYSNTGPPAVAGSFVEGALGVLYGACSDAYVSLKKPRRASLYAFLSARKFATLKFYATAARVVSKIDEKALLRAPVRDEVELILGNADIEEKRYASAIRHFVGVMRDANEQVDVEVQGSAVRGFLDAATSEARGAMEKRWDSGAMFPPLRAKQSKLVTHDSGDTDDSSWRGIEDDVLEDFEYFQSLASNDFRGSTPKRERRIESVIAELRKKKEEGAGGDPGGSLEMKIKRMRELSNAKKKKRRANSLLDRGAVVGEAVRVDIVLSNSLHFPVFLDSLAAVVSFDGKICTAKRKGVDADEGVGLDIEGPVQFVPTDNVTLVPRSVQRISVDVISSKPGKLYFLGVTWLFTIGMGGASARKNKLPMPGFCLLERRGRRLNSSRKQRASETPLYENDESLVATIATPEPRLTATIFSKGNGVVNDRPDSFTMRAGETRLATLLLRNEGKMPLRHVVFRIGTPQTFLVSIAPDKMAEDNKQISFAVGMNEQTEVPHGFAVAARVSVNLEPDESISVPVLIRATIPNSAFSYRAKVKRGRKGGENRRTDDGATDADGLVSREARMVIAYGTQKVRVSRIESRFTVQPSIIVSPRFLREADPSVTEGIHSGYQGVLLGLEIEHGGHKVSENETFEVTNISITSQQGWKPRLLQKPAMLEDEVSNEICQSQTSLRVNETATVFFFVVRDSTRAPTDPAVSDTVQGSWETHSVELVRGGIGKEAGRLQGQANSEVASISEDHELEQKARRYFVLCGSDGGNFPSSRSKQMNGKLAYISVGWKSSSIARGQVDIPPIDPLRWMSKTTHGLAPSTEPPTLTASNAEQNPEDSLTDSTAEAADSIAEPQSTWLSVLVEHAKDMEHDFFNGGQEGRSASTVSPVIIPVDVLVRNMSPYLLDVVFAAPSEAGIADGDRGRFWAGDVAMSLRALPPGGARTLRLTGVVTGPGRYNMSKFAVVFQTCGYRSARVRSQVNLPASYLVMRAKAAAGRPAVTTVTAAAAEAAEAAADEGEVVEETVGLARAVAEIGIGAGADGKADGEELEAKEGAAAVARRKAGGKGLVRSVSRLLPRTRTDEARGGDDAVWNASDTESEGSGGS